MEPVDGVLGLPSELTSRSSRVTTLRGLAGLIRRAPSRHLTDQADLIASLNEVADAVSSALGIDQVLARIVESAKRVSETDKAVLVLADERDGSLDMDTMVVRGRRHQHLQEWWQDRLAPLSDRVFASHEVVVEPHPEHGAWLLASPIRVKDHPIGLICAINSSSRPFSDLQLALLAMLSAFAASAIENARLAELSRYVLLASERDRIAHEMHDGVVQSLFSISLGLELCKKQVFQDSPLVATRLDGLQSRLNEAMTELRRHIYDLRPMKLAELGLAGAIEYWIREVTLGRDIKGMLVVEPSLPPLSAATEACLYRVARESVSNVVRHSRAGHFEVRLSGKGDLVRLAILDDGHGFDAASVIDDSGPGLGLKSIRDRVDREGGVLTVESTPASGTRIAIELRSGGA